MTQPVLTFFCELDTPALTALFADPQVIADLQAIHAGVSLGLRDLSAERAAVVRRLNEAGIPASAWLLRPEEQGYWFNLDNAPQALAFYDDFLAWTAAQGLQWDGVGLDIEPDMRAMRRAFGGEWRVLLDILRRALDSGRYLRGLLFYRRLVARIRADGYRVDSYEIPLMVDERRVKSVLLQRLFGLVSLDVDREVLMLYTSFLRPNGAGALWSYAPKAASVGVGSLGGGVTVGGVDQIAPLTWDEFTRDLLLAQRWCDALHVFSLEGAVKQGFLARLRDFDWTQAPAIPWAAFRGAERFRRVLRAGLWASAHPGVVIAGVGILLSLLTLRRRKHR
ncbi:MAG TPA: hypothetical protein PKH77_23435 [Anaerolineae bacterium]|nr:hypothetical protein [Anaerolineae bacterium]